MSDSKAEHEHQLDMLMEARELFMDAEFDQAMAKFKEAAAAATASKHWLDLLTAETGQAEVLIQKRDWAGAGDLLKSALAAATVAGADSAAADGLRDLIRARFMSGVALLGQRKSAEARAEFDTARRLAESADDADAGPASCRGYLPDIQDRLEDIDKEVEEDDLLEIAIEFGVSPPMDDEDDEDDEGEEEEEEICADDDDDDEEEEEDEDEEAAAALPKARKRPAAPRANGNEEDEDDLDDDDDEESEDEDAEAEAVPQKRSRMSTGGRRVPVAAAAVSGKGDAEEDDEDDEEVSSSA